MVNSQSPTLSFNTFAYQRPDMDAFTVRFEQLLTQFEQAPSLDAQSRTLEAINELRSEMDTMYNLCYIRHTKDTRDAFYEAENNFFDQNMPTYQALISRFYEKLLHSTFRPELESKWGKQLFNLATLARKTFDPVILEDLQEENQLSSAYVKLKASAKIPFQGQEHNLASIQKLEFSADRATRQAAAEAKWGFFAQHAAEVEQIFDQLVKVRHRIAGKLGFKNFIELAYARMRRSDYNADMVAGFREQIRQHIVPIASALYERQRQRLGLEKLKYYDVDVRFRSGNPAPKGDTAWIIQNAARMYRELSPETNAFFELMRQQDLMDLETRPGKATGGYCTFVSGYQTPYIFSNFNGTSGDIEVLTHEAGHAFQVYSSRQIGIDEYQWPTYEACEIHSMSMEFFTWPWMELFFAEDTDKFKFNHLSNAVCFLPYGVAVDEFQHFVYEHPDVSPQERNAAWRAIEQKYLPHLDYNGNDFLENGGFWYKQTHIFTVPFYYIDYTLAQICAFQFWKKSRENHAAAWNDYLRLCQAGGSQSFLGLVQLANLQSPFGPQSVASVVAVIKEWLSQTDDSTF
ncbi:MAG TPA: M3 family oligoendopeptidase [Saprospiraceae bacterium]|nr:M3 family oligoendopeptidase [Saprospiraceae bacterium]HMP24551.1 M3 family oligoendopeptidase [Saprospiraceae bacterium]